MHTSQTFLVTGALGCIGAWVLYHLARQGHRAVSFDASTARHRVDALLPTDAQDGLTFVQGDLRDMDRLTATMAQHGVTHVLHLAALQVPSCRANPALGAAVNVGGTIHVLEAMRRVGLQHLAYASSIAVYGPPEAYAPGPVTDAARPDPRTLYGVFKTANEGTARVYWQDHGLSSIALRPYTVFGVGRDQGLTSDPTKAMRAAVRGAPFEIGFGGRMLFQWASDVARQFIDAARDARPGAHAFNLGTGLASVAAVVDHIRAVRPDARITIREDVRLPFPEALDDAPLRAHAPHVYDTPLAEAIRHTMNHFETLETL